MCSTEDKNKTVADLNKTLSYFKKFIMKITEAPSNNLHTQRINLVCNIWGVHSCLAVKKILCAHRIQLLVTSL